ncbi:DUF4349 domain-containing protein [Clostridium sp.]|uniref:DUF4349 domain-containing protein n=1 Tax=Clostridium sp. TaxID=1506 RepID=UPI0032173DA2
MKKLLVIFSLIIVLFLSGCGNKVSTNSEEHSKADSVAQSSIDIGSDKNQNNMETKADDITNTETLITKENRKIINNADLSIETLEFDNSLIILEKMINSFNGYTQSSSVSQMGISSGIYRSDRNAEFVIRIPNEKFQDFLNEASKIGIVTNERTYGDDISSSYYDSETRLKVLKTQEDRYLAILSQAKDIKEIIEVEKALTEIRYEIEGIQGHLKQMDDLIEHATINMHIQEVIEASNIDSPAVTFGEKIAKAFKDSLRSLKSLGTNILLIFVAIIPYLIILSIVGYLGYAIYKKAKLKRK